MKTFYLVRHVDYKNPLNINVGRLPAELSDEGIKQAQKLGAYFADKGIARIYSSPVLRCKQTSEIISDKRIPVAFDLRLAETFSAYQGMWYSGKIDFEDLFSHRKELGGESFEDLKVRTLSFFNEINAKETGNVIICSHSDPLWCLYLGLLNRPLTDEIKEPGENGNPEYLKKGAIRPLRIEKGDITAEDMILQENL